MAQGISDRWFFLGLILIACISGLSLPTLYDWSGTDQSRISPAFWPVTIGLSVAAILFSIALPWLPIQRTGPQERLQFNIRGIVIATAFVAAALAFRFKGYLGAVPGAGLYLLVIVRVAREVARDQTLGWRAATVVACNFGPFAWVIVPSGYIEVSLWNFLLLILGVPGIVASQLLATVLRTSAWESSAVFFAAVQLWVIWWFCRSGSRRAIGLLTFVWLWNLLQSFGLHGLVRM